MKKSHIKMLLFQCIMFIVLILNSFVSNILKGYNVVIFLGLCLVIFKIFFGFERDRHRHTKDVIVDLFIFIIVFFMLFYVFGLVIEFAKTDNYYTIFGFKTFVIPIILVVILKEILRYMMLEKSRGNKILIVSSYILFLLLDITDAIFYNGFATGYNIFMFIALSLLPAITSNLACTYVSLKTGYKPIIIYLLITRLYLYLLPIVPDPNEYITAIINLVLPLAWLYKVYTFFDKEKDAYPIRENHKNNVFGILIPIAVMCVLIYFTSGYFRYYSVAIATGSMEPSIHKGDIVIIDKVDQVYDNIELDDVIAFKYNNVVIIHRVINIVEDGEERFFYTKGDANDSPDDQAIEEKDVVGIIKFRVPYVGLPTVWINE